MYVNMVIRAARLAADAHADQRRKYTNRPYVEHPMRVAGMVTLAGGDEESIAAAWLHDVIEDCDQRFTAAIAEAFNYRVVDAVNALTNPSKQHPKLKRYLRKQMDREHIATCTPEVRLIKLCDRIDNLREMTGSPQEFLSLYAHESAMLAEVLRKPGDGGSIEMAHQQLLDEVNRIAQNLDRTPSVAVS